MAENSQLRSTVLSSHTLNDLKKLVWGAELRADVFDRWCQGFVFSEFESTALVQHEGGPCAVIAPVQAFLLKNAIFHLETWREVHEEQSRLLLIAALKDILCQCSQECFLLACCATEVNEINSEPVENNSNSEDTDGKIETEAYFHSSIRVVELNSCEELEIAVKEKAESFKEPFGVLLFLYSVLLTKGIDQIKNEKEDPNQPLIDGTHGHGSQSLINLLLTGRAVSNVWDNDKDVSGLKLLGITRQPVVGFLTLLEHLRFCEVGYFLKCPQFPIWILGSETHLTVLFSKEKSLCTPETREAAAKRIFKSFDPEGNNFISSVLLGDVLKSLELFDDEEYVEMMKNKLDSENLGIILLSNFMEEFFPNERSSLPEKFIVYHYNGLKRSCPDRKVVYQEGQAMLLDVHVSLYSGYSCSVLNCLQTKWPGLELEWSSSHVPSLN